MDTLENLSKIIQKYKTTGGKGGTAIKEPFKTVSKSKHSIFKHLNDKEYKAVQNLLRKEQVEKQLSKKNIPPTIDVLEKELELINKELNEYQGADYEFARESEYQNLGEDVKNSARHIKGKSLIDSIGEGLGESLIKRGKLLKDVDLELDEDNLQASLFKVVCLKKFPPQPNIDNAYKNSPDDEIYKPTGETVGEYKKRMQTAYLNLFNKLKDITESDKSFHLKKREVSDLVSETLGELRVNDRFNPMANQLAGYNNKTINGWKKGSLRDIENVSTLEEAENKLSPKKKREGRTTERVKGREYLPMEERKGKDIPKDYEGQAKLLMNEANFKAIQWGQSVTDAERKENMTALTEGVVDISDSLGIPMDKVSLDGKLSLAVGARGKGFSRASAHYEPTHQIINLTRKEGQGALAHEYFHALDNIVAQKMNTDTARKNASGKSGTWCSNGNHSTPMGKKAKAFYESLQPYRKRLAEEIPKNRDVSRKEFNYWVNDTQELFARAGENYIKEKMESKKIVNNHLCGLDSKNPFYLSEKEWKEVKPKFEELFNEIKKEL